MSTSLAKALLALSLLAAAEAGASPLPLREPGREGLVVSRLPQDQQPRYRVFEKKCGRCHELSRALDADFTADGWRAYLRHKDRRSGATFSPKQTEDIYQFLAWWSGAR